MGSESCADNSSFSSVRSETCADKSSLSSVRSEIRADKSSLTLVRSVICADVSSISFLSFEINGESLVRERAAVRRFFDGGVDPMALLSSSPLRDPGSAALSRSRFEERVALALGVA